MSRDALDAGVDLTGLRKTSDVCLLICHLIKNVDHPLDKNTIASAMHESGIANYYEICSDCEDLKTRNIISEVDGKYYLLPDGEMVVREIGNSLSGYIRRKSLLAMLHLLKAEQQEKENIVEAKDFEKGTIVRCRVPNNGYDLIDISLYVPDRNYADVVRENFQKNAPMLYNIIISSMVGEEEMIQHALTTLYDEGLGNEDEEEAMLKKQLQNKNTKHTRSPKGN